MELLNADSDRLGDGVRDRILDKRDIYERVISFFDVEEKIEALEIELSKN